MFNNDHGRTVPAVSARLDWADRAMSAGCPLDSQGGVGVRIAPPDHGCDQHVAIAIGVPATAGVELDPVDVAGLPRLRRLNLGDSRHLDHQELPTAVHDVAEVHDTPLSALPMVIAGLGWAAWSRRIRPRPRRRWPRAPTARQKLAETHERDSTAWKPATFVPADRADPSQVSTVPKPSAAMQ